MNRKIINILISTNDKFLIPTVVMLTSLFTNNSSNDIVIYLMHSHLSDESINIIYDCVKSYNSTLQPIKIEEQEFDRFITAKDISIETYYRLLANEYLPSNLDRILWLDSDTIVTGDIKELYYTDFKGNVLAACKHSDYILKKMEPHFLSIGLKNINQYINAGVLLINLELMRKENIREKIAACATQMDKLKYADQDIINLIFEDRILILDDKRYNAMVNDEYSEKELDFINEKGTIIHFCRKMKPWILNDVLFTDKWEKYYKLSPYGNRPLKRISSIQLSELVAKAKKKRERNDTK